MAASRVIPGVLRAAPLAALAFLVVWGASDVLAIGDRRWSLSLLEALVAGVVLLGVSAAIRSRFVRAMGLLTVGASYLIAHAFVLGVPLVPALLFVSILIVHVELRILAERFAPLYEATLGSAERGRIRGALGRAILRLSVAAVLSVAIPILAADLALAGIVPVTTIPTAILLAGAIVAVVVVLALMPALERRTA